MHIFCKQPHKVWSTGRKKQQNKRRKFSAYFDTGCVDVGTSKVLGFGESEVCTNLLTQFRTASTALHQHHNKTASHCTKAIQNCYYYYH